MYRRRRERREHIVKKCIWLLPFMMLIFMFILGACTTHMLGVDTSLQTVASQIQSEEMLAVENEVSSEFVESGVVTETIEGWVSDAYTVTVLEQGNYTSKEEVALYIHTYGKLPANFVTKKQAQEAGWDASAGNLDVVLPGVSIGGSSFGNFEGKLPSADGRNYYECDIDYTGGYRGSKRIIYSNDGLIFYTPDHYETFERLY